MIWNSWSDFWHMGGYALYVWGSFGVCFVVVLMEIVAARIHRRVLWRELLIDLPQPPTPKETR